MSYYRKGADFERKVKKQYEEDGYYVIRSAGSKGAVDLIAFHHYDPPIFIQCKIRKPTNTEHKAFEAFLDKYKLRCEALLIWPEGEMHL